MSDQELHDRVLLETLINAKEYNGVPNEKSVMGRLMSKYPEYRKQAKEVMQTIASVVAELFPLSMEEVDRKLEELDPEAMSKREAVKEQQAAEIEEKKGELVDLPNAREGEVVVRFAPDPSKFPHIGHALNYTINRMYADKYKGKVILRFDDTNPTMVKPEYFDAIKEGIAWANIRYDKEVKASDYLEDMYEQTKHFIEEEVFYVCTCEHEVMSELRNAGKGCPCRTLPNSEHHSRFDKMLDATFQPGQAIVRLSGNLSSNNNNMRDPVMLRILHAQHPLLQKTFYVWPMYDFESAFMDHKLGITHIIRSNEFGTMRGELQSFIIEKLGGPVPHILEFGRYNILGAPLKGRVIRDLVERGIVSGWDDIRLFTIAGWRNRGIQPGVLKTLIRENGTTPRSSTIDWSQVEKFNIRILEKDSPRLFFVENPIKINLQGIPSDSVSIPFHPEIEELGERTIVVKDHAFVSQKDLTGVQVGQLIRLKDLCNIKILSIGDEITAEFAGDDHTLPKLRKIQWVGEESILAHLKVPSLLQEGKEINENSLSTMEGRIETSSKKLTAPVIVQLERVGYAKLTEIDTTVRGHIIHPL